MTIQRLEWDEVSAPLLPHSNRCGNSNGFWVKRNVFIRQSSECFIFVNVAVGPEEELLSTFEDGLVMRYSLTNGPYLIGFRQIKLDRVEGAVEGLTVPPKPDILDSYRSPQANTLTIHPLKSDIFFVGTEEGCLHRCSTYYPHQYSGIQQVHRGSVSSMQFSPFSPKIFLTCGSDWLVFSCFNKTIIVTN